MDQKQFIYKLHKEIKDKVNWKKVTAPKGLMLHGNIEYIFQEMKHYIKENDIEMVIYQMGELAMLMKCFSQITKNKKLKYLAISIQDIAFHWSQDDEKQLEYSTEEFNRYEK